MRHQLLTPIRVRNAEQHLGLYGLHVHQEGHEPLEHRFRADDAVNLYSGSKTYAAVAIGIAEAEGLLSLDDTAVDFFPDLAARAAPEIPRVTVRHLLQMTSGSRFTGFAPGQNDVEDWAAAFLTAELVTDPGSRFEYSNASTYMLGRVVHAASGLDLRDYLLPRLFQPLGIGNPQWFRCPRGFSVGASGLHLRTSEFARLGRLLLQRGSWQGSELVPAGFVDRMHTDTVPTTHVSDDPESTAGYGYQVWLCSRDGGWRADGKYGQFSVVLPEQRAVVTMTAHHESGTINDILRAVWDDLLPLL